MVVDFYRLYSRPDRAPANGSPAAGIAVRARPHFALDGVGRDGVRARPLLVRHILELRVEFQLEPWADRFGRDRD